MSQVIMSSRILLRCSVPSKVISRTLINVHDNPDAIKKPPRLGFTQKVSGKFTPNTKVIVVAGNILSGKSKVAKGLAKYYDMDYVKDVEDDDFYTFKLGKGKTLDLRCHNSTLPQFARYKDTTTFWTDKKLIEEGKPLLVQHLYLQYRFYEYCRHMYDLFETGRGKVFARDVFSEPCFSEAAFKCGMLSERAYDWITKKHAYAVINTWRPHVVVFVTASNQMIKDRIKERNLPWEVNSPYLNDAFMDAYRDALQVQMERFSRYSEIVILDRERVDIDCDDDLRVFSDQMTALDLEGVKFLRNDAKFADWRLGLHRNWAYSQVKRRFADMRYIFDTAMRLQVPGDLMEGQYGAEAMAYQEALRDMDHRLRYSVDSNPSLKDKFSVMFNPFTYKRGWDTDLTVKLFYN